MAPDEGGIVDGGRDIDEFASVLTRAIVWPAISDGVTDEDRDVFDIASVECPQDELVGNESTVRNDLDVVWLLPASIVD